MRLDGQARLATARGDDENAGKHGPHHEHATPFSYRAANGSGPRYNHRVRAQVSPVVVAVVLAACGGSPKAGPTGPTGTKVTPGASGKTPPVSGGGNGSAAAGPIVVKDIGCPAPTCVFHAGTGGYYTCTNSGAGMCFHFGPACTPAGGCMYDAADRTYKQCAKPVEGTCQQWGAACAPASKCMFDPKDGYHRQCEDTSGGTCKRFGALCSP